MNDTVFALATAPGRAAVAVIRLSGPRAGAALRAVAGRLPLPRLATLASLRDTEGAVIDRGLVLWFPAPSSYTGEDCGEFHIHGGGAIIDRLTSSLLNLGLCLAEPGEFTRRAFENGKVDLDQAEAIADLIDAETSAQARQAVGQLRGSLGRRYQTWRDDLLKIRRDLEAAVDFPEEDLPSEIGAGARAPLAALLSQLDLALGDGGRGQRIRDGYRIAIVGAPNAGKSTLFNALLERDATIVTPEAGTTRDIVEAPLTLKGYKVVLADTAGIRATTEPVEVEGVRRAVAWARTADLRLWVVDGAAESGNWRFAHELSAKGDFCLINKGDLPSGPDGRRADAAAREAGLEVYRLSFARGDAKVFHPVLERRVAGDLAGSDFPAATRARHSALLCEARIDLARALTSLDRPELAAEDVRRACRSLSRIAGRIGAENVLDRIFSTFCIGK